MIKHFTTKDPVLLDAARDAWSGAAAFRARRERHKRYAYGDQWCDTVLDADGRAVREDVYLQSVGKKPLSNNLIRQLIKTVTGRYIAQRRAAESQATADSLSDVSRRNSVNELDCRMLEEFLISGCAIQRVCREERLRGCHVWIDNVDPRRFFADSITDPRTWDVQMLGMIHDFTFPEVLRRFAGGSRSRAAELAAIFDCNIGHRVFGRQDTPVGDFLTARAGRCRVLEVWTLDCRHSASTVAGDRLSLDFGWQCRWLAPDGTVLASEASKAPHGEHPFVVRFYPLTDGEVHSFVEDIIDQQRYINRLIVMIDHIMSSSAKGVLLFPEDQLPPDASWADVKRTWAHCDGVIPITGTGVHLPQQVVTPTANTGAYQLLDLQMTLLKETSGVTDVLLGRTSTSVTGKDLYERQVENASAALADLLDTFAAFTADRDRKARLS